MLKEKTNYLKNLEKHQFHKLIIGAALKDYKTIEEFAYLFTHAQADVIDISAFPHSVICAKKGITEAIEEDPNLTEPLIMVSVNIGQDPHFRRIELDQDLCTECLACIPECPSGAFAKENTKLPNPQSLIPNPFHYNENLCFGCSNCLPSCHFDALSFKNWTAFETKSLRDLKELGAKAIEIHLNNDLEAFSQFYRNMQIDFELESFCIGSGEMQPEEIKKAAIKIREEVNRKHGTEKEIIIQTDGRSMTGATSQSDQKTIDNAKIVLDLNLENVYVQLAGGTNEKSLTKSHQQEIKVHGLAIGSYARKKLTGSNSKKETAKSIIIREH